MDNKSKQPTKTCQRFTKNISIDSIKELIQADDKKTLENYKAILFKRINSRITELSSTETAQNKRHELAEKYEQEEEMLYLILESYNTKESTLKVERLRRITYDVNRRLILTEIAKTIQKCYKFPNQSEIASLTGLSRQTVLKHLNDLSADQEYQELRQSSAILLPSVMAMLYSLGMKGDVRALKVYLDFHRQGPTTTFIKNQQNNYDQTEPFEIKIVSTGVEMKTMEG